MKIKTFLLAVSTVVVLAGCAVGNNALKNMTASDVDTLIVDNQTTKTMVVKQLGEPNFTREEADGTDVIEYTWFRSRPSAKNFIPLNPIDEFPTTKKTLVIWLNDAGVVTKHSLSGVFYVRRVPLIGEDTIHSMRPFTIEELDDLVDPTEAAAQTNAAK